ncbi:hypothetical protein EHV15_34595 [Paenibacillus oralis]|uniref:Uncharacterized protein n=1 Tax=Paenibacillus oralis TaxID=2490856 RepID=A0A3P3TB27_9BACL|nr:hypothetical protein [Paenibacillus oralis]RRJ54729.1 hypothetical protein EHV15_34595 [Paenibacillus oralis]
MKVVHNKQLQQGLEKLMSSIVVRFNEQWGTKLHVVEVEITDTTLEEVVEHNFIYLRTMITDGAKEAYWTSKLTPVEYSTESIEFVYLPVVHPRLEIDPGTIQYWHGEIISHFSPKFFEAGWDRSLYVKADW